MLGQKVTEHKGIFSINRGNSSHHIQNSFQVSGFRCQEGILEELKPEH